MKRKVWGKWHVDLVGDGHYKASVTVMADCSEDAETAAKNLFAVPNFWVVVGTDRAQPENGEP